MGRVKGYRNVGRHEHHHFRGWVVCLKRRGRRVEVRYFKDGARGAEASLGRALAYRDRAVLRLPPPLKLKTRYSANKTGVIGVSLTNQRTRAGKLARYYVASWNESGRKRKRVFSIEKYGKRKAFGLAVAVRKEAVQRVLSSWKPGGDYHVPRTS